MKALTFLLMFVAYLAAFTTVVSLVLRRQRAERTRARAASSKLAMRGASRLALPWLALVERHENPRANLRVDLKVLEEVRDLMIGLQLVTVHIEPLRRENTETQTSIRTHIKLLSDRAPSQPPQRSPASAN